MMKRILFLMSLFLGFSLTGIAFKKSSRKVSSKKDLRVTTVYFPTDGLRWTDKIISSFNREIIGKGLSVKLTSVSYQFGKTTEKSLIQEILQTKPDYVFLPDDFLCKAYAEGVRKKTGAKILFSSLYSEKKVFQKIEGLSGVLCDAPIADLVETASHFRKSPITGISLVGGPFAAEMAKHIKSRVPKNISFSSFLTSSWQEYQEIARREALAGRAVFTLAPFGVKIKSGQLVKDELFKSFLTDFKGVTLGYGGIENYPRTASMGIKPELLGKQVGNLLYKLVTKDKGSLIEFYKGYNISFHKMIF